MKHRHWWKPSANASPGNKLEFRDWTIMGKATPEELRIRIFDIQDAIEVQLCLIAELSEGRVTAPVEAHRLLVAIPLLHQYLLTSVVELVHCQNESEKEDEGNEE